MASTKVCYVVDGAVGAAWVVEQLRELRDKHQCDVTACVRSGPGSLIDALRAEGIPVLDRSFAWSGVADTLTLPAKVLGLARVFRRQRFDVVQTHLFRSMVIGRLAAWLADVPVRLAMIAGPYHLETHVLGWIDRSTCWMDTAVIASCEYTRALYRRMGVPAARLELVYYGPDERRFDPERSGAARIREEYGWPADTPLVGMVAHFYEPSRRTGTTPPGLIGCGIKGHEFLIEAMPAVLKECPAAKLLLIGAPLVDAGRPILERLKALVRDLGLEDSVVFTGFRQDIPACLRALNVSVQPSLNENLGGTIESLLMECPLVATRVGGMVDSVRDGETGVLVEPARPDELARAIVELLRDPDRARRLGRAGRKAMLERFTLRHTARDLKELYARLMQEHGDARRRYRLWVSWARLLVLVPVSAFLVLRLTAETLAFDAWDRLTRDRRVNESAQPSPL